MRLIAAYIQVAKPGSRICDCTSFIPPSASRCKWYTSPMATVTFDTLKFVKTLEAAGVPAQQAEAISVAVRDSHEAAELATKEDIRTLQANLRELELRMTVKLGAMMAAAVGLTVTLLKLL